MMRIILFVGLALMFCGCSESPDPRLEPRYFSSLEVDGMSRSFLVHLPDDYYEHDVSRPLVIGLHGAGGSAIQFEEDYDLHETVNQHGGIAVFPEGVPSNGKLNLRFWNAGNCCHDAMDRNIDDVAFIRELIEHLTKDLRIDKDRVYVTGMSNGGMLAYRLACEIPEYITAVAVVSGALMTESCTPNKPVPILHIHSEKDLKVPMRGGKGLGGYHFTPTKFAFDTWASANQCDSTVSRIDHKSYYEIRAEGCMEGYSVALYVTQDGGHSWPGARKARPAADEPSQAIEANDVIWTFFTMHDGK